MKFSEFNYRKYYFTVESKASKPSPNRQNKKKTLRIENAKKRVMAKGKTEEEAIEILKSKKKMPNSKTMEDFLKECEKLNVKHKLEVRTFLTFRSLSIDSLEGN
jgi:hypothetical protein